MFAHALALVTALLLVGHGPDRAWAGAPTDQLKAQIDRTVKILEDPELKKPGRQRDRRTAVRQVANEIFDFSETAKRSLARHWAARSQAEREEFVQLFGDLLERSYISKIELYGGEKIKFVGETTEPDGAIVRTRLVTRQDTEIPIDYRMHARGDKWLVYDVLIEGVSLISNYRTQFNKIITTSSYQELVKKMKSKQEEFIQEEKRTSQR
ncbi:MAG: organic solvent tolerance ABC transporter substrate-binding protein [Candidatus Rokuibacteriota bacterium]|nr:MAG: organic solvent tolerance ABC transporter substrate-binding protein [Candidatus Rokubacteria bacterium]